MAQLLSFRIRNYRSFYSEQVLRFGDDFARAATVIFGPNAGGKSNTAKAINTFRYIISNSANANYTLPYDPFLLRERADSEDTSFEAEFISGNRIFTYRISYNAIQITSEVLKVKSEKVNRMQTIFERDKSGIVNQSAVKFGFGKRLLDKTRKDTLLITKAREDNNKFANIVFDLVNSIFVISGDMQFYTIAIDMLRINPRLKTRAVEMLKACDFAIRGIKIEDVAVAEDAFHGRVYPEEFKRDAIQNGFTSVFTAHAIRDADRKVIGMRDFNLDHQESMGTKKFFEVIIPIISALEFGGTVYIDEFGAFFHPMLATTIIELFKSNNEKGASLILNSHNTAILSVPGLARDDVLFVSRNLGEESVVESLSKKAVRENESFEKRYREGLYGAIPIISENSLQEYIQ